MEDLMKRQVIVVGAGPGGSTAAFYLAKKGIDVLLVDKEMWPREKPCGGTYLPAMYPIFEDMGIMEEMQSLEQEGGIGVRLIDGREEFAQFSTKHKMNMPRRYGDDCIRRAALRAGADFMEDFDVQELIMRKGQVRGVKALYHNREISVYADVVIIANGAHSMLARRLGSFETRPDLIMYCYRAFYTGVEGLEPGMVEQYYIPNSFPVHAHSPICSTALIPQGLLDDGTPYYMLCVTVHETGLRETQMGLQDYVDWWMANSKYGQMRCKNAKLIERYGRRGWRLPSCEKLNKSNFPGAILIGDANAQAECAFEYGINPAAIGGKIAAETIYDIYKAGGDFSEKNLAEYQRRASAYLDPAYELNALWRRNLLDYKDRIAEFVDWSKQQSGYPHNTFDKSMTAFLTEKYGIEFKLKENRLGQ